MFGYNVNMWCVLYFWWMFFCFKWLGGLNCNKNESIGLIVLCGDDCKRWDLGYDGGEVGEDYEGLVKLVGWI